MDKLFQDKKTYDYRPRVHFAPPRGTWTNDPNGMVYLNGRYHLFYQYYPTAPHWGPMHWGHAVTQDLIHWQDLPTALYPDELGCIFSGSCVYDRDNLSGFGRPGQPPLIAVFTSHSMDGKHTEHQSLAYSTDYEHFEKYYGNPVIPNPGQKDFRDPKLFWNPVKRCYSLVLAAGDHVEFYSSGNLKQWEKTREFKAGVHGLSGICECPDCFPLPTPEGKKWVLVISMILPREQVGQKNDVYDRMTHITQYYVGDFDGDTFRDTECAPLPLLMDYGTDNYAPVCFQNLEEKVMIGWADNWDYANFAPSGEGRDNFRGKMTFPRRMRLVKTASGYRLASANEGLDAYRAQAFSLPSGTNRLHSQTFGLKIRVNAEGSLLFSNQKGERILVSVKEREIQIDRTQAGQTEFHKTYAKASYGLTRMERLCPGPCEIELLMDRCLLEILADDGLLPFTFGIFPTCPYETLQIDGGLEVSYFPVY